NKLAKGVQGEDGANATSTRMRPSRVAPPAARPTAPMSYGPQGGNPYPPMPGTWSGDAYYEEAYHHPYHHHHHQHHNEGSRISPGYYIKRQSESPEIMYGMTHHRLVQLDSPAGYGAVPIPGVPYGQVGEQDGGSPVHASTETTEEGYNPETSMVPVVAFRSLIAGEDGVDGAEATTTAPSITETVAKQLSPTTIPDSYTEPTVISPPLPTTPSPIPQTSTPTLASHTPHHAVHAHYFHNLTTQSYTPIVIPSSVPSSDSESDQTAPEVFATGIPYPFVEGEEKPLGGVGEEVGESVEVEEEKGLELAGDVM
ncbi:hypothetical protein HK097_005527, partial [Rhizophlyctis rosea]